MMDEHLSNFLNELIEKTKKSELKWNSLRSYKQLPMLLNELPETYGLYIDFYTNSVKISDSYYLEHNGGFLYLLYIWHSSEQLDGEYFIVIRINPNDTLRYIDFNEIYRKDTFQKLKTLSNYIAEYLEEQINMPADLYNFIDGIVK